VPSDTELFTPDEAYESTRARAADRRTVLVHVLTGFIDAGQAGALARDHLLATMQHRRVATFDVDRLLDYRSRRPPRSCGDCR